ncbi:MAG: NAD-dependent epimerase/dehydratase family protein [Urechidicola sp.]|nr:NAD-dependent epimerase/dehydratase family protein [Urechidicola sp.]
MKEKINIAISCVGSGIGQSIINSCNLSDLPIKTFGLDFNPFSYGAYNCDEYIKTQSIDSENYISSIIEICLLHKIDLLFPGTDDEVHLFSKNISLFEDNNIGVIVSDREILDLCRNKELANNELSKIADIFVKSYNINNVKEALLKQEIDFPIIAKPLSGSASMGVYIITKFEELSKITENYVIQEIAKPHRNDINKKYFDELIAKKINPQVSEISIQLVANKESEIIGKMVSINKLKNGVPVEIIPFKGDASIWSEIDKLIPAFKKLGLRGPINIQGRITDKGLKIFEINPRFTGITGLRAKMGFNEVEGCIKEWLKLSDKKIRLSINHNLFGIRQIEDKAINISRNSTAKKILKSIVKSDPLPINNLLLTGATGYLGLNLIDKIIEDKLNFNVWALVRDKKKAKTLLPKQVILYDENDLMDGTLAMGNVDFLIHSGFARPHRSTKEIADSLLFTSKLFRKAVANHVANIINISSQSVYGQDSPPPWKESSIIAPTTVYATAKYTTELSLAELALHNKHINSTSIRLCSVCGAAKGMVNVDIISRFVETVKKDNDITIIGGEQLMERLNIYDTITGIIALLNTPSRVWKKEYNLGSNVQIQLQELAEKVIEIGKNTYNKNNSKIINVKKDTFINYGLNSDLFMKDTGWNPTYSIEDSIHSLFKFKY